MSATRRRLILVAVVLGCALLPVVAHGDTPSPRPSTPRSPGKKRCPAGMAAIPGGTFEMAGRNENVTVGRFCIDVTEVTAGDYKRCVEAGACTTPSAPSPILGRFCTYEVPGKSDHPVNCVDWDQAVVFCRWVAKLLPSDEEWEWAARGAEARTTYPWPDDGVERPLCWKRFQEGTCAVGAHRASDTRQGVTDLSGNVAEWVSGPDKYTRSPGRVIRGGSWQNFVPRLASAGLGVFPSSARVDYLGFRCAKTP